LALRLPQAGPLALAIEVLAGAAVLGLVVLGGLHLKLSYGPIDAGFLVEPIERAINAEIAPLHADIAGAALRYEEGARDIRFRLERVVIRGEGGTIVAEAPSAGISLSAGALLAGQIAPSSIELIRPRLQLEYSDATGLSLRAPGSFPEPRPAKRPRLAELPEVDTNAIGDTGAGSRGGAVDDNVEKGFRVSIAETMSAALTEARRKSTASSYLTGIGLVEAEVLLDAGGERTRWRLPRLAIDLEHREKRSIIRGAGQLATLSGPVSFELSAEESEKRKQLVLTARVSNLVPRDLTEGLTGFGALAALAMPVSGDCTISLSSTGELQDVETTLDLGGGAIALTSLGVEPIKLDDGKLQLRYVSEDDRIEILPSILRVGQSRATVTGTAVPRKAGGSVNLWEFNVSLGDVQLADEASGLAPAGVDEWTIRGAFVPRSGLLAVERMRIKAGGGLLDVAGRASATMGLGLRGVVSAMPTDLFKRLWPRALAPPTRTWVMANISGGRIVEGQIDVSLKPEELARLDQAGEVPEGGLVAGIAGENLAIGYVPGMPPIVAERASLKLNGSVLSAEVPHGIVTLASGQKLELRSGRLDVTSTLSPRPDATAEFEVVGEVDGGLELLSHPRLALAQRAGFKPGDITGRLTGAYRLSFPLIDDLKLDDIAVRGNARVEELGSGQMLGPMPLQGGTLDLVVTEAALDASGKVLLDGVPAEITWSRPFEGQAQPLKLSAVLDATDRDQLDLAVNHFLIGDLPVTLTVTSPSGADRMVEVEADLTPAELVLDNMAWRKPPGQTARLTFRLAPQADGGAVLENVTIIGDGIDVAGSIWLDKDRRLTAFEFPEFSMNFLSRLRISGKVQNDVWKVRAAGTTYDGRTLFKSFFSAGQLTSTSIPEAKTRTGIDLEAEIDAMVGFEDTTVRNVELALSRRAGKLKSLKAKGTLASGEPIFVRLDKGAEGRRLVAETRDAGNAFRLVGFYSNVEGGEAILHVNLDGRGAVEKSGTLWTRRFEILGDTVVKKVLARSRDVAEGGSSAVAKPERQRLYFNQLKVPFSVGSGQLVLHDSIINGPTLGATMRGKVDFDRGYVQISGTYVPLYGLNSMLGSVPILGDILTGGQGGGIVGLTFVVQGNLKDPQVGVNPVSALTPGIFRQIFETDPGAAGIQQRKLRAGDKAVVPTTSSLPVQTEGAAPSIGEAMEVQTVPPKSKKKGKTAGAEEPAWEAQSN
jgi:hypothetical protein